MKNPGCEGSFFVPRTLFMNFSVSLYSCLLFVIFFLIRSKICLNKIVFFVNTCVATTDNRLKFDRFS